MSPLLLVTLSFISLTSLLRNCITGFVLFKNIRRFIDSCNTCLRCRGNSAGTDGLLNFLEIPDNRWSSVSMDFVSVLPYSNGFNEIMVVVNRLTKRAHFIPTTDTVDAPGATRLFVRNIVRLHGVPSFIFSDLDVCFVSDFWSTLHECMGFKFFMSTPYHPQTDSQTKRINRILCQLLCSYCINELCDWSNYIDIVEFAYNNSYQKLIDTTLFITDLGYQPNTPGFHSTLIISCSIPVKKLSIKLKALLLRRQDQVVDAQRKQAQANKSRNPVYYKIDDYALISRDVYIKSSTYRKVQSNFVGPFRVVAAGSNNCELDIPDHRKFHRVVNVEHLRSYVLKNSYLKTPLKLSLKQEAASATSFASLVTILSTALGILFGKTAIPGTFSPSNDFFQQFVPADLIYYIWQNTRFLSENRDNFSC